VVEARPVSGETWERRRTHPAEGGFTVERLAGEILYYGERNVEAEASLKLKTSL